MVPGNDWVLAMVLVGDVCLAFFWSIWLRSGSPMRAGLARAAYTISQFLSGFLMPLRPVPAWFRPSCAT